MIVVLVPMLGRAHRVAPLLASLTAATTVEHRALFIVSPADHDVHRAVADAGANMLPAPTEPGPGDYARKINHGYRRTTEPFIFLGADDLHFHPGWDTAALEAMTDERIGVVGTQDLGNTRVLAGEHATHSLVRRTYIDEHGTIDEPGKVLHEGYWHEYVDDELVGTAKHRHAWAFAADSIVEHLHPNWGKMPTDATYAAQRERMRRSRPLFLQRQQLWT